MHIYIIIYMHILSSIVSPPASLVPRHPSNITMFCQSLHDLGSASYRVARAATHGLKLGLLGVFSLTQGTPSIQPYVHCLFLPINRKDERHQVWRWFEKIVYVQPFRRFCCTLSHRIHSWEIDARAWFKQNFPASSLTTQASSRNHNPHTDFRC